MVTNIPGRSASRLKRFANRHTRLTSDSVDFWVMTSGFRLIWFSVDFIRLESHTNIDDTVHVRNLTEVRLEITITYFIKFLK